MMSKFEIIKQKYQILVKVRFHFLRFMQLFFMLLQVFLTNLIAENYEDVALAS